MKYVTGLDTVGNFGQPVLHPLLPRARYPELLRDVSYAWVPSLGATGNLLRDISGRGNDASLVTMNPVSDWVGTTHGLALNFDGSSDYAITSRGLSTTGGTLSACVSFSAFPSSGAAAVVVGLFEPSPNTDANQIYLGVYNNAGSTRAAVVIRTAATTHYSHYGSDALSLNTVYHLALTKIDGATPQLWVNGRLQTLTALGGDLSNTKWFDDLSSPIVEIGARITGGAAGAFFAGNLYSAIVRPVALSAALVEAEYRLSPVQWLEKRRSTPVVESIATGDGVGAADGHATAEAVGASTANGVGAADGHATGDAVGASTFAAAGSADGHSTAESVGTSSAGAVGSADGHATGAAVGASTADSVGSADGDSTAAAVGDSISGGSGVGSADGHSTAAAVGQSTADSAAAADGHATAAAVGISTANAVAAADGHATAAAVGTVAGAGPDVPGIEYRADLDRLHYRATLDRLHYRLTEHESEGGPAITAGLPYAAFSATPLSGFTPLTVAFTDSSTGTPTSWLWTFGDGGTSTQQNPSHEYVTEGTYDVSLTVMNANGTTKTTRSGYVSPEGFTPEALGDLILAWFDAGYGLTADDSDTIVRDTLGINPGIVSEAGKRVSTIPTGFTLSDGSILLDGINDFVESDQNTELSGTLQDITIAFWAKLNSTSADQTLFAVGTLAAFSMISINTTHQYIPSIGGFGIAWQISTQGQDILLDREVDSVWHHHCIRLTRGMITLDWYIDGVLAGTTPATTNIVASPLVIGKRPDNAQFCSLNVTDFRIYLSALSDVVIGNLAAGQDYTTGLSLHYPCEVPVGDLVSGSHLNSWTSTDDAHVLTQATVASMPHYLPSVAGLSDEPAVRFNGTEFMASAARILSCSSGCVFIPYYLLSTPDSYQTLIAQSDTAGTGIYTRVSARGNNANSGPALSWADGGTPDVLGCLTDATTGVPALIVFASDGSTITAYVNGIPQIIDAASGSNQGNWFDQAGVDNFTVGSVKDSGAASLHLSGYIPEIFVTDPLTETYRTQLQSWLANKYSIELITSLADAYEARFAVYGETLSAAGRLAIDDLFDAAAAQSVLLQRGWLAGTAVNLSADQHRMLELTLAEADFVHYDHADSTLTVGGGSLTLTGDTLNKGYLSCGEPVFTNANWSMLMFLNTTSRDSTYPPGSESHFLLNQFAAGADGHMFMQSDQQCGVTLAVFGGTPANTIQIHDSGMGPMKGVVIWITYDNSTRLLTIVDAFTNATLGSMTLPAGGFADVDLRFGIPEVAGYYPRISQFIGLFKFRNVLSEATRDALFATYYDVMTRFNNQILVYGNSVTSHSIATKSTESWSGQFKTWCALNNSVMWMPGDMGSRSLYDYRHTSYTLPPAREAVLGAMRDPLAAAQLDNYVDKRINILVLDDNQNIHAGVGVPNGSFILYSDFQHIIDDFVTRLSAVVPDLKVVAGTSMATGAIEIAAPHDPISYASIAASYWKNNQRDWSVQIRVDAAFDAYAEIYGAFNLGWPVGDDGTSELPLTDLPQGDLTLFAPDDPQHPNDDGHDVMYAAYRDAVDSVRRT